jgi:putative peptidoglycan lipid II flippase
MLIAERFGTGAMADLFYVAYRIPNMLRELFAEGALSSAFIPTLTQTLKIEGRESARRLYTGVFVLLSLLLMGVILVGEILAPEILSLLAPGWAIDPNRKSLGTLMVRIMFPFLYFISISALLMGIFNARRIFFIPAASPIAFSLALILAALLPPGIIPGPPVLVLAFGVLLGGIAQWGIQWIVNRRNGLRLTGDYRITSAWQDDRVRSVLKKILPSIGGLWVTQGNLLIATLFGSYLATGTIAALYYAMRLIQFPLGLIGAAIATVLLPLLSLHARSDNGGGQEKLIDTLTHGYRASLFFMVPASAGLVALREPLIRLLFEHGKFDRQSAAMTGTALIGYAIGLWSFSGVRIIVRAYYALGDMKTPVWAALAGLATNLAISALFTRQAGIFALAFGISAGSLVNQGVLYVRLENGLGRLPWEIFGNARWVLIHSILLYGAVRFSWVMVSPRISAVRTLPLLSVTLALIVLGTVLYGALAVLSKITEGQLLKDKMISVIQRKKR